MRRRTCTLLAMIAAAALLPSASASHWCGQTLISFAPQSAAARETTFTIQVRNTGPDTITLTDVVVEFPWEGTYRSIGSGAIAAGQVSFFTTVVAPPTGTHIIEVRITGTSTGDASGTSAVTCNTTFQLNANASAPGLEAPLAALAVGAAAIVARRREVF